MTIASKHYIQQMINFKTSLQKWDLDRCFLVLCLDRECLQAAKENGIMGYDGYLMTPEEAAGNWHVPVARLKVFPPV